MCCSLTRKFAENLVIAVGDALSNEASTITPAAFDWRCGTSVMVFRASVSVLCECALGQRGVKRRHEFECKLCLTPYHLLALEEPITKNVKGGFKT